MNRDEIIKDGQRLIDRLEAASEEHRLQIAKAAQAERDYRKARAMEWATARGTDKTKEATVNARTAELRELRDIAKGLEWATIEEQRNYRQQLSFLQSVMANERIEGEMLRYGQGRQP